MGWVLFQQLNPGASSRHQKAITALHDGRPVGTGDRIGLTGKSKQLRFAGGGGDRQQKTAVRAQPGQAIGRFQQKGHAHAELGWF